MKKSVRVEIDEELHRKLKIKAAVTGITIAEVIRESLYKWLEYTYPIILPPNPDSDQEQTK